MTVQIGANESQTLNMNFPEVSCLNLGLRSSDGNDKINLCTQYSSENALNSMDRAIKKVSGARSTLGSYQNRLETTDFQSGPQQPEYYRGNVTDQRYGYGR